MSLSAADQARAAAHGRLVPTLALVTCAQIVATASVLALTALAPAAARDLGVGVYFIGYQISVIYAAGMFTSAVAGTLVQRFGAVRIERLALLLFVAGFLGLASASVWLVLLATVLIGFGYGLNNPAASQMLMPVTPARARNFVFSLKQSGVPLGGVVASLALPALAAHLGWRGALALAAAAPAAIWLWAVILHGPGGTGADRRARLGRGIIDEQSFIWRDARLRVLAVLGLLYSAVQLAASAFAVVTLLHDLGWGALAAGGLAAAMQLAGAFGRVGWGVIADRIGGDFRALGLIGFISGLCCLLFPLLPALPAAAQIALFVVLGATSIGWNGVFLAAVARYAPPARVGAITGGVLVYTFVGVIIGPSGFAAVYLLAGSYGGAFGVFSLFGFLGAVLSLQADRRRRRQQPAV